MSASARKPGECAATKLPTTRDGMEHEAGSDQGDRGGAGTHALRRCAATAKTVIAP